MQGATLSRFVLDGPEFGASAFYVPTSRLELERFAFGGPTWPPIELERDRRGKVVAVEVKGLRFEK